MMVNLLDDSNFHRQTAVMTRLIEMIIQNPVFGIFCIISMLAHPTSQCLVGNLSSPGCNEINVMSLSNTIPRTKRSYGHKRIQHPNAKKSSKPRMLQDTWIFCIISMLAHPTSQCLTSFTNIQKSTECTLYAVNDIFSRTVQRVKRFGVVRFFS
jgi:hypothetical protein